LPGTFRRADLPLWTEANAAPMHGVIAVLALGPTIGATSPDGHPNDKMNLGEPTEPGASQSPIRIRNAPRVMCEQQFRGASDKE